MECQIQLLIAKNIEYLKIDEFNLLLKKEIEKILFPLIKRIEEGEFNRLLFYSFIPS